MTEPPTSGPPISGPPISGPPTSGSPTSDFPASGPLRGIRVIEMAGLGPGPFAAMLLADLGADVIRVERPAPDADPETARRDVINRGKRSIAVDLKSPEGLETVRRLLTAADVVVEGFRPGVMERLGLGPDDCLERNPRLVYGRMTGWGQDGPLAPYAGHDIDYVAVTGVLWAMGRPEAPPPVPLNLVGDYAGGSMFLVMGVLAALLERAGSGRGQVIDAAMVDGVSVLATMFTSLRSMGVWSNRRGANFLDGAAPYYDVYVCADDRYLAVGPLEPQFYAELVRRSGFRAELPDDERVRQDAPPDWATAKAELAALFVTRTRDEWAALLSESDACVAPVLDWDEAPRHPHLSARGTFTDHAGITQPSPAPRFSRTPAGLDRPAPYPGEHDAEIRAELAANGGGGG